MLAPNRAESFLDVRMSFFGPSATMRPSRSSTTRSISGMISETWCVTRRMPRPPFASTRQLYLRADIERVAGLIEQQRLRLVHQRASDQRAFGFTRGHLRDRASGKVRDAQAGERCVRLFEQSGIGRVMRENTRAAEKAGEHHVAAGRIARAGCQQIGETMPSRERSSK